MDALNHSTQWHEHAKCGHQETTAYAAVQTISLGEGHADAAIVRALFPMLPNGHGQYSDAVHYARRLCQSQPNQSYPWTHVVPATQYACGHILW